MLGQRSFAGFGHKYYVLEQWIEWLPTISSDTNRPFKIVGGESATGTTHIKTSTVHMNMISAEYSLSVMASYSKINVNSDLIMFLTFVGIFISAS